MQLLLAKITIKVKSKLSRRLILIMKDSILIIRRELRSWRIKGKLKLMKKLP